MNRSQPASTDPIPVVIVGAGPVGLTAATLLGQYGVDCLVLDRWEGVYPQPRAVHLDDEVYRIVARIGIAEQFAAVSRPTRGLQLIDRNHRVFAVLDRAGDEGRHGHPRANMFDQPELEHLLRTNLKDQTTVGLRGNVEVTDVAQDGQGRVRVNFTDRLTGQHESLLASYVLGCDGANSVVRAAIGSTMQDLAFEQRWLVIDIATTADLDQWEGVHQVCDPHRAATFMRIGKTRYRWEFRLLPGETAADFDTIQALLPLIEPVGEGHAQRPPRARACRGVHVPGPTRRPLAGPQRVPAGRRRPSHPSVHRAGNGSGTAGRHEPQLEDRRRPLRRPARVGARHLPGGTQAARAGHDPPRQARRGVDDPGWPGGRPASTPDRAATALGPRPAQSPPGQRNATPEQVGPDPAAAGAAVAGRKPVPQRPRGRRPSARRGDRNRLRPGERRTARAAATGATGSARRPGRRSRRPGPRCTRGCPPAGRPPPWSDPTSRWRERAATSRRCARPCRDSRSPDGPTDCSGSLEHWASG